MSSKIKNLDGLISDAIWLCRDRDMDRVSPPFFQRLLSIDYYTAGKVVAELEKTGLIVDAEDEFDGEEFVRIGKVNKEKLAELLKN